MPKEEFKLIINDLMKANGSGRVIFNFTPQKWDHNVSVRCEAYSEIMKFPLVKKRRLDVHFKTIVVLTLKPKQLVEGRNATLCCVVESNPHSNITWIVAQTERRRHTQVVVNCLVWSSIQRTQNGAYKCIAENYLGSVNATIDIQVYYEPRCQMTIYPALMIYKTNVLLLIIINQEGRNGTLNLQCNPSGEPNNYTFLQLEHRSEFNEHIRFLNSSNNGSVLRISIEDAGLQDTGIYVCNVSNDVPDQNGRQFQSGKRLVEIKGQSVAKELYQSAEFVNSDNPQHLLKATESEGYVYYATASTSLNQPTSNNQDYSEKDIRK
ncbi:unnamed protein product [Mytilus coruscus]|uniref:Ig-like domain-containing protein n=1 Tax=Mytilus coruscus TaxID=42192 RepID=A0A6J8CKU4_MYTCO|nr:unnamed protein product [Mytilus coruscus]